MDNSRSKTAGRIILAFLLSFFFTTRPYAQINPRVPGKVIDTMIALPAPTLPVIRVPDAPCVITDKSYEKASDWNWTIRRYFTWPSACPPSFLPLIAPTLQGSVAVSGGRVNFINLRGAHENRILKTLGTPLDKGFELQFDLNVATPSPGTGGVGFIPVALTSDWQYDLQWTNPTSAGSCNQRPPMDEIGIICSSDVNSPWNNLTLTMMVIDNGNWITMPLGINLSGKIAYGATAYITMDVYANGNGSLNVYSDAARTKLISEGLQCFTIPPTVAGLTYIQHGTASSAGHLRSTNAWADNISVCKKPKSCCTIDISGNNLFCNVDLKAKADFTLSGDFNFATATVTVTPSDVSFVHTGNQVTITNWGAITPAPKVITISVTASSCECGVVKESKNIYVYARCIPTRM